MNDWTRPSVFIQWKGTNACLDLHCLCDAPDERSGVGHFDGYHAYALRCVRCGRIYELPQELALTLVDERTPYEPQDVYPDE